MLSSFRVNITSPGLKVRELTQVLNVANLNRVKWLARSNGLDPNRSVPERAESNAKKVDAFVADPDFRTLLFTAFIQPANFQENGLISSWYNRDQILERFRAGLPVYKKEGFAGLSMGVADRLLFLKIINSAYFDFSEPFPESSIERYEQFMALVKKYEGQIMLTPPLDVDLVWQAHMLDHKAYVSASKDYFGRILGPETPPNSAQEMRARLEITAILWKKSYGQKSSSFSSSSSFEGN